MKTNQWDTYAQLYNRGIGLAGDSLHQKLIDPLIFSFLGEFANKTILDAGCGNGYLLTKLAEQAKSVTGADQSKELLKFARKNVAGFKNVKLVQVNLLDPLPFDHATFDVVIANMTLQYLPELATFAMAAHDVLKARGQLIVIIDHPAHALFLRAQELVGKKNGKFLTSASYFTPGLRLKKSLWGKATLEYYHRPLKEYLNVFTNKFRLQKFEELVEDEEVPRIAGFLWQK